jgi:hypothetical protein
MKTNIQIVIVVLLACLTGIVTIGRFQVAKGKDFYQYWGVSKAQEWSSSPLKSPSAEQDKYAEVLNAHVAGSSDLRLVMANKIRRHLQLLQTPLCYSIFMLLPENFSLAFGIFQIIQVILFLSSLVLLSGLYYGNWVRLLPWGFLLIIFYWPLGVDLEVGNLNCLHLFGFALLLVLADCIRSKQAIGPAMGASFGFMAILVFLSLMKPSWNLVTLLLAAYLWVDRGTAIFVRAAAAAVACGAVLLAWPCVQFGSWMVWQDWYRYLQSWDSASMLVRIPEGNYAPVLLASQILGASVLRAVILLGALLAASLLIALMMAKEKDESVVRGMVRAAIRSLHDHNLIMATGITATFFLSPLVWFHYYLISLIPAFWLLSPRHPWSQAHRAGLIAIILTSNFMTGLMRIWFGFTYHITCATCALGLFCLWAGILAAVAAQKNPLEREVAGPILTRG